MRYRWVVLAAGTLTQTSYAAIYFGVAVLAPALQDAYGLSLRQLGLLLAAVNAGSLVTLLAWGLAADRLGERPVAAVGLSVAAAALAAGAFAATFAPLLAALLVAGAAAAGQNAATGRAVMHWFVREERGLALGIRQTAVPIAGAIVSLALPHVSVRTGILGLAAGCALATLAAAALLREARSPEGEAALLPPLQTLRDRRIWRLSWGSSLLLAPQICLVGFVVVFLHERRGFSAAGAAAVLAAVQLLGIAARVAAGRWSDLRATRVVPIRRIALAMAAAVALTAALASAPRLALVPALVVAGVLAMSWNGLSFTLAAETGGHARSGAALGLQQTALALASAVLPPAFAVVVGATSWAAGFALVALAPLAAWSVFGRLS